MGIYTFLMENLRGKMLFQDFNFDKCEAKILVNREGMIFGVNFINEKSFAEICICCSKYPIDIIQQIADALEKVCN